ncbi:hydantoinase B/oxoprolinase family protein [Oceanibacterium hippocampi]|uniref:Acetophenone carboxylase delta subunit n=1 Tax=Oceanibacterium hippocampi TaxID=745714 RepID=A0A1Y5TLY6_9PROT|nr:hydantoinase B/oxoprolinase family protein [Oceanibacterium hippocampi]SLN65321.1 Acetophenone carboxylase delta subunit [Oceanibacterium hippocampi]
MSTIDDVTLAVIQNGLQQVCNEMDLAFQRAAFSPTISETMDRSDGIYHRDTGDLIAQGEWGMPIFVGCMQFSTQAALAYIQERGIEVRPGDVFMFNDPYMGGTHVMDVKFLRPFFYKGQIFAWFSNTGHWPDCGGMVPSGFSSTATEIEQEGLRLPPVKIFKEDEIDEEILSIVLSNVRVSEERIGDIKAQIGALTIGDRRLTELLDRYGADTVDSAMAEFRTRAAQLMRARIGTIPDGTYEGEAFVDSDGIDDRPLRIHVTMRKTGTELHFDLSQSSPPCAGPMNSVLATTKSAIYLAVKHIFPDVPINAGTFEPIHIADPDGTFLYAEYPRPVSGCAAEVSQRVCEAVFDALVKAVPDLCWAAPAGTVGNLSLGGRDPRRDRHYVMYNLSGGGYGGSLYGDGMSNGCSTTGNAATAPVEVLEQYYPILFEHYRLHERSGGPGKRRGGLGVNYRVRLRGGNAKLSFIMDHGRSGPLGAAGGADGAVNRIVLSYKDGRQYIPRHLSKDQGISMTEGDSVEVWTPGGGGYGNPLERDPASVTRDVFLEYYTIEDAAKDYGVVIDPESGTADLAGTAALRAQMMKERAASA